MEKRGGQGGEEPCVRPKVVLVSLCVRVPSPYYVDWVLKIKDMEKGYGLCRPTDQIPWFGSQKGCPEVEQLYGLRFAPGPGNRREAAYTACTVTTANPDWLRLCSMWDESRLASASGRRSEGSGSDAMGTVLHVPQAPFSQSGQHLPANEPAFAAFSMDGSPRSINLLCVTNAAVLHEHALAFFSTVFLMVKADHGSLGPNGSSQPLTKRAVEPPEFETGGL